MSTTEPKGSGVTGVVYTVTRYGGRLDSLWTTLEAAELRRRLLDDQGQRGAVVAERAVQFDDGARL